MKSNTADRRREIKIVFCVRPVRNDLSTFHRVETGVENGRMKMVIGGG